MSGRELGDGQVFQHKNEIDWICLSQCGNQQQRLLAIMDKNHDLYITLIRDRSKPVLLGQLSCIQNYCTCTACISLYSSHV